ncbi:MAG: TetR family transcriptional regulator [Pseudomonadota bacterium]
MVRRTKDEAQETRNGILDAAERMFGERGVSRTSLEDIADAAGVTRGAIYWHFANKNELFQAMADRVLLPMEDIMRQAAEESTEDPVARLAEACVQTLRRTVEDAQCRRVLEILCYRCESVGDLASISIRHRECRAGGLQMMERAFRNAVRRGQLPAGLNARRAAVGLDAFIMGLVYAWLLDPASFPLAREARALVDTYLGGLAQVAPAKPASRAASAKPRRRTAAARAGGDARRRSA